MRILTLLVILLFSVQLLAAEKKYSCSDISIELKTAAKAIIRLDDQNLEILENGEVECQKVYAITIMDENGEALSNFYGPYNKYLRLKSVSGRIYNAVGELEETLRGEDIMDVSMISSYSLYEDNRIKIIRPEYHEYPYTVEYTVNYKFKSLFIIPNWKIYPDYNVAVEKASFSVTAPDRDRFRFMMRNLELEPEVSESDAGIVYLWNIESMTAVVDESLSPALKDVTPFLLLAPNSFDFGGSSGSMATWEEFGAWAYSLREDKRELSAEEESRILSLVEGVEDKHEKVSILYRYMQNKVRYVNITMGIGGFEPIAASQVSEVGYGDCKALSNYMCSMLEVLGIESRYTLVRAGRSHPDFISEFPSQQFNHAIVAVPFETDTMWLECTSQILPAGYLGAFTDNREVLMVSEKGGELAFTPKFAPTNNSEWVKATCKLDANFGAEISYSNEYRGRYFGDQQSFILNNDKEEQKRSVQNGIRLSGFEINDFNFTINTVPEPVVGEQISISVKQMISPEGEYIPLQPGILSQELTLPGRSRNRLFPIVLRRGFVQQDSVSYLLPGNLEVHLIPDPVFIETEYGKFESHIEANGEQLSYYRRLILYDGSWSPDKFRDFYSFLRKVSSADKRKVLLLRK